MKWRLLIFSFLTAFICSCHKEYSCEGNCNPAPVFPPPQNSPAPIITALNCATGSFSETAIEANPYSGHFSISYAGGNGGSYNADTITSTGVTGLTAVLAGGYLASGNSTLVYTISGIPSAPGSAIFTINMGGQSCTATLPVDAKPVVLTGIIRIPLAVEKNTTSLIVYW
jgi:hypothetical protein